MGLQQSLFPAMSRPGRPTGLSPQEQPEQKHGRHQLHTTDEDQIKMFPQCRQPISKPCHHTRFLSEKTGNHLQSISFFDTNVKKTIF